MVWRHDAKSLGYVEGFFRIFGRDGIGYLRGIVCFRHRLGDMGLDCFAIDGMRRDWIEADVWPSEPKRRNGALMDDG